MANHVDEPQKKGLTRLFKAGLLFGMAALAILMAACGSGDNTNSNTNKTHILKIAPSPNGDFTENFNPLLNNGNGGNLFGTDGLLYQPLTFYNQMKANDTSPMLAQSQTLSSDGLTATFHLRTGLQWSDGQAFSSADVVFTINYIMQHKADGVDLQGLSNFVKNVSAPDANTVVVTFNAPSSTNMWYLAGQTYILPQHIWQSITTPKTYANTSPVVVGPYTVKSFSPQVYKFAKNPKYYNASALKVDEVDYLAFASNTGAQTLLSTDGLDWTGLFVADVQNVYVNRDPAHNQSYQPGNNTTVIMLNLAKPMSPSVAESPMRGTLRPSATSMRCISACSCFPRSVPMNA